MFQVLNNVDNLIMVKSNTELLVTAVQNNTTQLYQTTPLKYKINFKIFTKVDEIHGL